MDIYLNEQELQREKNLFAPSEIQYPSLKGKSYDIYAVLLNQAVEEDSLPEAPPSC